MTTKRRVVVAGHVCLDLIPALPGGVTIVPGTLQPVGRMDLRAGGCVANTGSALAELGADVRLYADVGADTLGDVLIQLLVDRRIDTRGIERIAGLSTSYSVVIETHGKDRLFWHHVGANATFDGRGVDLHDADLVHLGYPPMLPAMLARDGEPLSEFLTRARVGDVSTSVDLAVAPSALAVDWRRILERTVPLIDIFTPSLDDLRSILGRDERDARSAAEHLAEGLVGQGAAIVMVTAGAHGLALRTGNRERIAAGGRVLRPLADAWADHEAWFAPTSSSVVTTTGAGDAATAGLLFGLLQGLDPAAAGDLASTAARYRIRGVRHLPHYFDNTTFAVDPTSDPDAMLRTQHDSEGHLD